MTDKIAGFLEVSYNNDGEVVVNHPDLKPDDNGVGHIVFSPNQARNLAELLRKHATLAENGQREKREAQRYKAAEAIPVDRSARVLTNGLPETPDHRNINPLTGQQKAYVVLSAAERAKGFVRPVRRSYRHLTCGQETTMSIDIAETFARDPSFYSGGGFCCTCRAHFPNSELRWVPDGSVVGS